MSLPAGQRERGRPGEGRVCIGFASVRVLGLLRRPQPISRVWGTRLAEKRMFRRRAAAQRRRTFCEKSPYRSSLRRFRFQPSCAGILMPDWPTVRCMATSSDAKSFSAAPSMTMFSSYRFRYQLMHSPTARDSPPKSPTLCSPTTATATAAAPGRPIR